jgi:hypothetical protein
VIWQPAHLFLPGSEHPGLAQVSMDVFVTEAVKNLPANQGRTELSNIQLDGQNQLVNPPQIIHEEEGKMVTS